MHLRLFLTHRGRVTHICVDKLTIIGSCNGLSPRRRQAIIRTNAGILLIGPLGTNFSEILIEIHTFSLKKVHLKMSSAKWRPFWIGFNVLTMTPSQSPCTARLPVVRAVGDLCKTWSSPNLYLDQPITKAWCQPIEGNFSHPTCSLSAPMPGLCSHLTVIPNPNPTPPDPPNTALSPHG